MQISDLTAAHLHDASQAPARDEALYWAQFETPRSVTAFMHLIAWSRRRAAAREPARAPHPRALGPRAPHPGALAAWTPAA